MGAPLIAGMSQAEWDSLVGSAQSARDQLAQTGTVNGKTETQNLAAVANQAGNTSGVKATPYIKTDGTTDYHLSGMTDDGNGRLTTSTGGTTGGGGSGSGSGGGSGGGVVSNSGDSGAINAQNYINQLNDLRKNAAIAALGKSHDAALSNLGNEKSAIQPKYYDQRNQVAAGAQQQARNFAEYMANRGGSSSGANAQATLSNNMTTQGNLGTLGRQEAQAYTDIERRTTDVNNAYQSDVASATANAEADKMQALLADYYQAQQRGDTLAQNQIQNAIAQSQLAMQQQGQQFDQSLATSQQKQNEANTKFAQQMQIDAVTYQKARDAISDKNYQTTFENNIKQQGFENALKTALQAHQISNDNYQLAISQQNANTSAASQGNAANNSQINQLMDVWKATGKAPAGIPNVTAGTPYGGQTTPIKAITSEEYQSNLKPQYDNHGKLTNAQQIEDQIILSGMSEWEQYKSYKANGIPWTDPIPTKPN